MDFRISCWKNAFSS